MELDRKSVQALTERAWIGGSCPDLTFRDPKKAVELATRACELTGWHDPRILGILSSACYRSGEYGAAAKWQAKANDLTPGIMNKLRGKTMVFLLQKLQASRDEAP